MKWFYPEEYNLYEESAITHEFIMYQKFNSISVDYRNIVD